MWWSHRGLIKVCIVLNLRFWNKKVFLLEAFLLRRVRSRVFATHRHSKAVLIKLCSCTAGFNPTSYTFDLLGETFPKKKYLHAGIRSQVLRTQLTSMTEGMRGSFEQKREEVERAHIFRARAKLTLRESSPDEPKPDIIDYQACFEL